MKYKKIVVFIFLGALLLGIAGWYIDQRAKQTRVGVGNVPNIPSTPVRTVHLSDYGKAPEFMGISSWLNSNPLTLAALKGKVVLIDFWTYSCINCIRTFPYVKKWYETYKDKGFVLIGIHTPEFAFERNTKNVRDAMQRFGITYPVAQDNDYQTWNAYNNAYWPAEYLIDASGKLVYIHTGEGEYDRTENAIRSLLGMDIKKETAASYELEKIQSPEMYFGLDRISYLSPEQESSKNIKVYTLPSTLLLNNFALQGTWKFEPEYVQLVSDTGTIRLKFFAAKVHIVASSDQPATLKVRINGNEQQPVIVKEDMLYTLFDSTQYFERTIEIEVQGRGFKAFTFTFG